MRRARPRRALSQDSRRCSCSGLPINPEQHPRYGEGGRHHRNGSKVTFHGWARFGLRPSLDRFRQYLAFRCQLNVLMLLLSSGPRPARGQDDLTGIEFGKLSPHILAVARTNKLTPRSPARMVGGRPTSPRLLPRKRFYIQFPVGRPDRQWRSRNCIDPYALDEFARVRQQVVVAGTIGHTHLHRDPSGRRLDLLPVNLNSTTRHAEAYVSQPC